MTGWFWPEAAAWAILGRMTATDCGLNRSHTKL